jgi:sec-independent protein translocase protein TatB
MLDIGWGELVLIGVIALIVVGPKDLPALFRTVGNFTGKARAMARDFQRSLEQAANESGVGEVSKSLRSFDQGLSAATDSARKFARSPMRGLAEEAIKPEAAPTPDVAPPSDAAPPPDAAPAAEPSAAAAPPAEPESQDVPPAREPTAGR